MTEILIQDRAVSPSNTLERARLWADEATVVGLEKLTTGARIKAEIELLWKIYEKRRAGATFYFSDNIVEDRLLATRYYDERAIEETYRLVDTYSKDFKQYLQQRAEVTIYYGEGLAYKICSDESDSVTVAKLSGDTSELLSGKLANDIVEEFFHRSLIAASTHENRSTDEKAVADAQALVLMREQHPNLFATEASHE